MTLSEAKAIIRREVKEHGSMNTADLAMELSEGENQDYYENIQHVLENYMWKYKTENRL